MNPELGEARLVEWTDDGGYLHLSWLPPDMPDSQAAQGLPVGIPDLAGLDWEEVARELQNRLVKRGIVSLDDIGRSQNGLSHSILAVLKPRLIELYQNLEDDYDESNSV